MDTCLSLWQTCSCHWWSIKLPSCSGRGQQQRLRITITTVCSHFHSTVRLKCVWCGERRDCVGLQRIQDNLTPEESSAGMTACWGFDSGSLRVHQKHTGSCHRQRVLSGDSGRQASYAREPQASGVQMRHSFASRRQGLPAPAALRNVWHHWLAYVGDFVRSTVLQKYALLSADRKQHQHRRSSCVTNSASRG